MDSEDLTLMFYAFQNDFGFAMLGLTVLFGFILAFAVGNSILLFDFWFGFCLVFFQDYLWKVEFLPFLKKMFSFWMNGLVKSFPENPNEKKSAYENIGKSQHLLRVLDPSGNL